MFVYTVLKHARILPAFIYSIYLLKFGFYPVAVFGRLVHYYTSRKETATYKREKRYTKQYKNTK